jgi:ABC-type multidrug transport system, ATPase component
LELLEMVGLAKVQSQKVKTFSGGMIRRLGIAQALLNDPQILILDEPTAGLDPKERVRFRNLISSLSKDKMILLSTHIVSDIEYVADYILIMKQGRLLQARTREETLQGEQYKVWECEVSLEEFSLAQERYAITNMRNTDTGMYLRIVGDKPNIQNVRSTEATLEDIYFYEEAKGELKECGN